MMTEREKVEELFWQALNWSRPRERHLEGSKDLVKRLTDDLLALLGDGELVAWREKFFHADCTLHTVLGIIEGDGAHLEPAIQKEVDTYLAQEYPSAVKPSAWLCEEMDVTGYWRKTLVFTYHEDDPDTRNPKALHLYAAPQEPGEWGSEDAVKAIRERVSGWYDDDEYTDHVGLLMDIRGILTETLPPPTQREPGEAVPEVVCLCGSTRFADQHAVRRWELEKAGAVVLMINYLPAWYADEQGWDGNDHFGEKAGLKEHLDELHLRKIDMADRIHVVNPEGYVGESTAREVLYAQRTGKPVSYDDLHLTGPGVAIPQEPKGG